MWKMLITFSQKPPSDVLTFASFVQPAVVNPKTPHLLSLMREKKQQILTFKNPEPENVGDDNDQQTSLANSI